MIQKRLDNLQPYFRGLKVAEDYKIVELTIKKNWDVENTEDIMSTQKESKDGGIYTMFYSITKSFDEILDFVEEKIINYNLEIEEKERLLKAKVEELKRVFESKSLDELNNLKFTTEENNLKLKGINNSTNSTTSTVEVKADTITNTEKVS
jgi:hypothetical protein